MKCLKFKKPFPLYHIVKTPKGVKKFRICQDCGSLETCHGPRPNESWRHIILHPDYNNTI
jgi:hypothetical protein